MLYSCPNHELSREIIIQNFYAWLSHNDRSMLDTSCAGSFMKKTIEFLWDLLEIIKRNSEDWNSMKVKRQVLSLSVIVLNLLWILMLFKFSTKYGLDSKIVASFGNHLLLMLISLKRSGLNITHLLKKKLKNMYQLKKKLLFIKLIQLFLLLILRNHLSLLW